MSATILLIISQAQKENLEPLEVVQDYFAEKDSRITRTEALRLIALAERKVADEQHLD
jgi:hypothetical protein